MEIDSFFHDIIGQPAALRRLIQRCHLAGECPFPEIPAPQAPILTGMGASYHAVLGAAYALQSYGIRALALEATSLLYYSGAILERCQEVLYLSQSGASAEVIPFIDRLECGRVFLAITNHPESPLAQRAEHVLLLDVVQETTVATQTYMNSLALLWLLVRRWSGEEDGSEYSTLERVAAGLEALLDQAERLAASWVEELGELDTLICAGHGPHYATALQAAQTLAEWAKTPVLGISTGALRHGIIEVVQPGVGVILFGGDEPTSKGTRRLALELAGYGARVLLVEGGGSLQVRSGSLEPIGEVNAVPQEPLLSMMLDILPVQLFTVAYARQRGIPPGFRYLGKVVRVL